MRVLGFSVKRVEPQSVEDDVHETLDLCCKPCSAAQHAESLNSDKMQGTIIVASNQTDIIGEEEYLKGAGPQNQHLLTLCPRGLCNKERTV